VGGGNGKGIKCLHTHYAHYLATGENVVGELIAKKLATMPQCSQPCVKCVKNKKNNSEEEDYELNKHWTFPSQTNP